MITVWVSLAAAVGSVARYLLDRAVQSWHSSNLPWGTFLINVTGSCTLGVVTGMGIHHGWSAESVSILGIGLLGGYTTWSTFVWETVALAEDGSASGAVLNVAGSLAIGLAAAAAGLGLAQL